MFGLFELADKQERLTTWRGRRMRCVVELEESPALFYKYRHAINIVGRSWLAAREIIHAQIHGARFGNSAHSFRIFGSAAWLDSM